MKTSGVLTNEALSESEYVAGIQTLYLFEEGYWNGFKTSSHEELDHLLRAHMEFRPRVDVETDTSFKQIIPYFF